MPDEEKKTVDLDTSGPAMDVDVPETPEAGVIEEKEVIKEEPTVRPVEETSTEVKTTESEKAEPKKDDKELEQYSDSVQKRISKLTKKWREAERQKDEAVSYAARILKDKKSSDAKLSKLQPDYLSVTEDGIKNGMEAAQAKLMSAREANDVKAESDALAQISEFGYKKAKLEEAKTAQEAFEKQQTEKKPSEPVAPMSQAPVRPDPKAEAWSEKNTWFGQDNAMTYTAFDIHRKLVEEGYDPNLSPDEYYSEVDKRIRLEFPHKFGNNESTTSEPVQTVASAKRPATKGRRKTVKLTPSQVAISKRLGVPLEEYAKQLAAKEV